jgi:hypothetical protein
MKHISVKLTDADYSRLAEERGDKNISDHIRTIIFSRRKEAENELGAFQTLIHGKPTRIFTSQGRNAATLSNARV